MCQRVDIYKLTARTGRAYTRENISLQKGHQRRMHSLLASSKMWKQTVAKEEELAAYWGKHIRYQHWKNTMSTREIRKENACVGCVCEKEDMRREKSAASNDDPGCKRNRPQEQITEARNKIEGVRCRSELREADRRVDSVVSTARQLEGWRGASCGSINKMCG